MFIVFEGSDKAGKSAVVKKTAEVLRKSTNYTVYTTKEPGASVYEGFDLSGKVREMLLDDNYSLDKMDEMFLFLTDRQRHVRKILRPKLEQYDIVLSDRYWESSIVYQWMFDEEVNSKFTQQNIKTLHEFATGGLYPDITFILETDHEIDLEEPDDRIEKTNERNVLQKGYRFLKDLDIVDYPLHYMYNPMTSTEQIEELAKSAMMEITKRITEMKQQKRRKTN